MADALVVLRLEFGFFLVYLRQYRFSRCVMGVIVLGAMV